MISVLFVCLGNICRSPMAEAIFRHQVEAAGLADKIRIDSAGTGDWHVGKPPHEGTRRILTEHAISYEGIQARQVAKEDLSTFDYIVAMDNSNLSNLQRLGITTKRPIYRLTDLVPNTSYNEVPDPYFTGNFEEVYDLITAGCHNLLQLIRKEQDL